MAVMLLNFAANCVANIGICIEKILYLYFEKILHSKSKSSKRVSKATEIQLFTSWLDLLPIYEEHLALKKHRLPEALLRSIFQKEKILWARHCQDKKRVSKTVSSRVTYPIHWHPFIKRSAPSRHLIPFIKFSILGLKLPKLIFVDEHSTCFTRNCLLHFLGSVYSLSAIRRGVSNQKHPRNIVLINILMYSYYFLVKLLSKLSLFFCPST
ncbi:hypothetical protein Avbf_17374 [Armadillidium vulgare]|nr:hypothetical protein Avbf_17374 [Armadillidium vulgare]